MQKCRARYCYADLSVHVSTASTALNKCTYRHTSWQSGRGIILVILSPTAIINFQGKTVGGKTLQSLLLSWKWYEIGP